MIKIVTLSGASYTLTPTVFPDGTSQVWKLPDSIFASSYLEVTWNFEAEREIIDLLSLRKLLPEDKYTWDLHIPYLPYARQDKDVSNTSTFNLSVIADLINSLDCRKVTSVDVHNPDQTGRLINNFENVEVAELHKLLVRQNEVDYMVFGDNSASLRYRSESTAAAIVCDKEREPLTGNIIGHKITFASKLENKSGPYSFLIVDDLCDGGATFISVANMLRQKYGSDVKSIDLYVTHGVFSKGRDHLLNNGINKLFTTNSLTKNGDGYNV